MTSRTLVYLQVFLRLDVCKLHLSNFIQLEVDRFLRNEIRKIRLVNKSFKHKQNWTLYTWLYQVVFAILLILSFYAKHLIWKTPRRQSIAKQTLEISKDFVLRRLHTYCSLYAQISAGVGTRCEDDFAFELADTVYTETRKTRSALELLYSIEKCCDKKEPSH